MRAALKVLLLLPLMLAEPAAAHVGHPVGPETVWSNWRPDPLAAALLGLSLLAYGRGLARLWQRAGIGRGIALWEAASFLAGLAVTALALLSPLETAAGSLLTAHMVQHMLLVAAAPPLLLLGRPDAAFAAALPGLARYGMSRAVLAALRRLAWPLPATLLHTGAMWIWHAPGPFQAALQNPLLHDLEHACFFVTALLFWQSVVAAARSPASLIPAILAIVATLIQGGFLAALITLTGRPLYPAYGDSELWGLTALQDQQLAGLIMWVPAGAIYLFAALFLSARLIGPESPAPEGRGSEAPPIIGARRVAE